METPAILYIDGSHVLVDPGGTTTMFNLIKFSASTPGSVPGPEFNFIGNLSLGKRGDPPAQPIKLGIPWDDLQPTFDLFSVMRWSTRVSKFAGRDEEMTALWNWATSEPNVSAKFVVAPGGMGKTRLAAEFAQQMIGEKWSAGFVRLNEPVSFYVSKHGLLLLVDYPEQHPKETRELLKNLSALGAETHVRVLLLSRSDPDEWTDMLNEAHVRAKVDMQPLRLRPLRGEAAHELYTSALERLQKHYDDMGGGAISVEALDDWVKQSPENERALFVLAASVYEATTPGDAEIKYAGREIVTSLAEREIQRLREAAKSVGLDGAPGTHPDGLARLVALAAMHGPVPLKTVQAWAANPDLKLGLGDAEMIGERLREVHLAGRWVVEGEHAGTAASDAAPLVVKPPEPDIVAAALLHMVLFAPDKDDETANPERLWAAIEPDPANAFSRIERLADDMHYVLGRETTPLRDALERMVDGEAERCRVAHPVLSDVRLPQVFLPMICSACKHLLQQTEDLGKRADLYNDLSVFENARGNTIYALEANEEAVKIRRALTDENPARNRPDLASSLNNLSHVYFQLGRKENALEVCEEALRLYRMLSEENPLPFRPDLALSLNNLSICYYSVGRHEDALRASQEAVRIRRSLVEENPVKFFPYLATSLDNMSRDYSSLIQFEEALEASELAVRIHRALVEENPSRFRPELAGSLHNLSNRYLQLRRYGDALKSCEEVVLIRRVLCDENPARFRYDLANSTNNLSLIYTNLGRFVEALEAIDKTIQTWRELALKNP
ncbi:tetratricopeptide repeat protein [bacterium]|nr:tetratricopeptide repeat protein [bacterium]